MFDKERQKIGFIGYGEVAHCFSQRMREFGAQLFAYDKCADRVANKAKEMGMPLLGNLEALIRSCGLIISSLWPDAALDVAKDAAPLLSPGRIYCDINSISPETTSEMEQIISSSGADFVKIAVMAAIPDRGFAVPLLAGGSKAGEVTELLSSLGLNIRAIGHDPKQPAAIKILRSICLKGIIALTYEMLRGAEKYGVIDQVLESASEAMSKASFKDTATNWLASTAIHARRRAKEMEEAIETLESAGINPVMSVSTRDILEELAGFKLDKIFQGETPDSFYRVLEAIAKHRPSHRKD